MGQISFDERMNVKGAEGQASQAGVDRCRSKCSSMRPPFTLHVPPRPPSFIALIDSQ